MPVWFDDTKHLMSSVWESAEKAQDKSFACTIDALSLAFFAPSLLGVHVLPQPHMFTSAQLSSRIIDVH